jgi:hypothetical protein
MAAKSYLKAFLAALVGWVGIYFAFTWIIDPYGVSPLNVSISRVNALKPKRRDIDRLIKPYEVWRKQPRTVFLGTSRIHQSIDPAVLDHTAFAPAYNASVPASSLGLNISYLKQYLVLDPKIKTVVVELFIYNFLGQGQDHPDIPWSTLAENTATLFTSADALRDAISTFAYNLAGKPPTYEIKPGGYFYYPPGHPAGDVFNGFPGGIWVYHPHPPKKLELSQPSFDAIREFVLLAKEHQIELIFIATPNHSDVDEYIDYIDQWDLVEEWLTKLVAIAPVYSFSQPNPWVYEPVVRFMKYWNDPFHFSRRMGDAISRAISGHPDPSAPDNFMVKLSPENIPAHIQARREAIKEWAKNNPKFVDQLKAEHAKWLENIGAAKK